MGNIDSYEYDTDRVLFVTTVGAKAMTLSMLQGKYSLSQNCALIHPRGNFVSIRYYLYLLERQFDYEKGLISTIMQPSLRFEDLVKYKILLPPLPVQKTIAGYLDTKKEKI